MSRRLDTLAWVAGLAAALVLILRAPPEVDALRPLPRPPALPQRAVPPAPDGDIFLHIASPPLVPARILERDRPLEIAVSLPAGIRPGALRAFGAPLADHPRGGLMTIPPAALRWGVNILTLSGRDRLGRPIDRAWPLMVGDTREAGAWIEPALTVHLSREGFVDADDLDDDLSSIAERQVEAALARIPPMEAGPVTASHFRASRTEVSIVPGPGQLAVSVDFHRAYIDVEMPAIRIDNLVINHLWVDAVLTVEADALGRPRLELQDISPHLDLVERTEGFWNWLLDHAAWVLEIAGELLAEGPLSDAVTGALDEALNRWISGVSLDTVAPLSPRTIELAYRFAQIDVDDDGLTAALDVRIACSDGAAGPIGRLAWPPADPAARAEPEATGAFPLRVTLTPDGANGVLHALWRCGALDTRVTFEEAHHDLPLFVPAAVTTRFELPPVFQPVGDGALGVGVGGLRARVDYGDASYDVRASGHLPVTLEATSDGRGLRVGFDPARDEVSVFTDCLGLDDGPCTDNALFDRLAWLALPFLPPIGAEIPIPDVSLPDSRLVIRLSEVRFDPVTGRLSVDVAYEVP